MLTKRIIPCLDIKNGRTVKGVNFVNLIDAGDPAALAKQYAEIGADELVFLDISATLEGRKTMLEMVLKVAAQVNIPFTVGGGVSSIEDVVDLLLGYQRYLTSLGFKFDNFKKEYISLTIRLILCFLITIFNRVRHVSFIFLRFIFIHSYTDFKT